MSNKELEETTEYFLDMAGSFYWTLASLLPNVRKKNYLLIRGSNPVFKHFDDNKMLKATSSKNATQHFN